MTAYEKARYLRLEGTLSDRISWGLPILGSIFLIGLGIYSLFSSSSPEFGGGMILMGLLLLILSWRETIRAISGETFLVLERGVVSERAFSPKGITLWKRYLDDIVVMLYEVKYINRTEYSTKVKRYYVLDIRIADAPSPLDLPLEARYSKFLRFMDRFSLWKIISSYSRLRVMAEDIANALGIEVIDDVAMKRILPGAYGDTLLELKERGELKARPLENLLTDLQYKRVRVRRSGDIIEAHFPLGVKWKSFSFALLVTFIGIIVYAMFKAGGIPWLGALILAFGVIWLIIILIASLSRWRIVLTPERLIAQLIVLGFLPVISVSIPMERIVGTIWDREEDKDPEVLIVFWRKGGRGFLNLGTLKGDSHRYLDHLIRSYIRDLV